MKIFFHQSSIIIFLNLFIKRTFPLESRIDNIIFELKHIIAMKLKSSFSKNDVSNANLSP